MFKKEDIHHVGTLQRHNGNGTLVITTATYSGSDAFTIRAILALFDCQIVGIEKLPGRCVFYTDLKFDTLSGIDSTTSFPEIARLGREAITAENLRKQEAAAAQAVHERRWQSLFDEGLLNDTDSPGEYRMSIHWRAKQREAREQQQRADLVEQQRVEGLERIEQRRQVQEATAKRQAKAEKIVQAAV